MPLSEIQRPPLMCLTQDGLALSHVEQARQLCAVGAKWIQVRIKAASDRATWIAIAGEVAAVCRDHGAISIVNDDVDVALAVNADGVHLSRRDGDWREARRRLGPRRLLGGTINFTDDAREAVACACLDYVGMGPWRFTSTKQNLAPVLGAAGVAALLSQLGNLPAWIIGGITPVDLPEIRELGATGVAISSALYRDNAVAANFTAFCDAWSHASASISSP